MNDLDEWPPRCERMRRKGYARLVCELFLDGHCPLGRVGREETEFVTQVAPSGFDRQPLGKDTFCPLVP